MSEWTKTITLSRNDPGILAITVDFTEAYLKVGRKVRWIAPEASSFILTFDGDVFKDQGPTIAFCGDPAEGIELEPCNSGLFHYAVALTILRSKKRSETLMIGGCPSANIQK